MKNALLYPRFLQKFDLYLVKKYPLIWSIRAHYFLYYSLLSCLVLGGLAMITPIGMTDLDHHSNEIAISISSILAVTVACFWVYKTVIFDKQRQFGQRKITDEYVSFFLSYATLVGMWFIIFSYAGALEFKRANIVSDKELIEDVNTANLAQLFMIHSNNGAYKTGLLNGTLPPMKDLTLNSDYQFFINYNLCEREYKNGEYISHNYIDGIDSPMIIQAKAYKIKSKTEVYKLLRSISDLARKYDIYNYDNNYNDYSVWDKYRNSDVLTFDEMKEQYDSSTLSMINMPIDEKAEIDLEFRDDKVTNFKHLLANRFNEITSLKFGHHGFFGFESLLISSYFLLGICILLHIFKNVRWRQFIILFVVACLLPIIYAIFGFIFASGSGNSAEYYAKFCYYGTFFYGVVHIVLAYDRKDYSLWNIVGIMLFNVMILTVPLFTFLFMEKDYRNDYDNFNEIMYTIQVIEVGFYVIFMLPMLKRIYERIYALPRN